MRSLLYCKSPWDGTENVVKTPQLNKILFFFFFFLNWKYKEGRKKYRCVILNCTILWCNTVWLNGEEKLLFCPRVKCYENKFLKNLDAPFCGCSVSLIIQLALLLTVDNNSPIEFKSRWSYWCFYSSSFR